MLVSTAKRRENDSTLAQVLGCAYTPTHPGGDRYYRARRNSVTHLRPFQVFYRFARPDGQGTIARSKRLRDHSGFEKGPYLEPFSAKPSAWRGRSTEKLESGMGAGER